ncbi:MAG: response regulator [Butyrivibrio sp.]|nr:response regulator [Butyrivibrio sp.]
MNKRVLVISKGATFMVGAICNNLTEAGMEPVQAAPTVADINEKGTDASVFLFYLGAYVEEIPEVLVFLKDYCAEHEKLLAVVGDDGEFAVFTRSIPMDMIAERFARPLDVHSLVAGLERLMDMSDELSARKSILLVDDDSTFLRMMRDWLVTSYRVTVVTSGMQAIQYLAKNTPDLILLDYEMPVTSGPQVLEMIRSESATATTPVIFLTGKGDKESVMKVLALKPDGYLLKSSGKDEILKSVEEFFEQAKRKHPGA